MKQMIKATSKQKNKIVNHDVGLKDQPLVSIFLPYYNDQKFLKKTIESILSQSYQNLELILFNHASTDTSRVIAHSFDDPRIIHLDAKENLGAGSGYNLEISLPQIKGKYIKLFCADDVLYPDCLEKMVCYLEKHQDIDILFSDMNYIDEKGKTLETSWFKQHEDTLKLKSTEYAILKELFMRASPLPFPGHMFRAEILRDIKLDKISIMLFDIALWTSLLIANKKVAFLSESLISYRIHNKQLSSVSSETLAGQRSFFESSFVYDIFYGMKDIEMVKYLCPQSIYAQILTKDDIDLIPFVIAHYFVYSIQENNIFYSGHTALQINGYRKICELLNDPILSSKIKEKFNFGIKEFRTLYSWIAPNVLTIKDNQISPIKQLKNLLYCKKVKDLTIIQLLYLLCRRIFNDVAGLFKFKKAKKFIQTKSQPKPEKKRYTV